MRSISEFWFTSEMCTPPMCRSTAPKPQDHLPHVIRQAVDARADMAQVLEYEVACLVSHWQSQRSDIVEGYHQQL